MMNFDDFKRLDFDSSRSFISGMKEHRACSVELFCSVLQNTCDFADFADGVRSKVEDLEPNWTVQNTQSGRSAKVDGPEIQKWTDKSRRSQRI